MIVYNLIREQANNLEVLERQTVSIRTSRIECLADIVNYANEEAHYYIEQFDTRACSFEAFTGRDEELNLFDAEQELKG